MPRGPKPPSTARQKASEQRRAAWHAARAEGRNPLDDPVASPATAVPIGIPDNALHKIDALREAARNAGVRPDVINALVKRLRVGDPDVARDVKRVTGKGLLDALEDRLSLVLHYLDDHAVANASLKELALAVGILVDKTQLLKNLPTQIVDFTSRQQLQQLAPRLMAEMKRRGVTIEGEARAIEGPA